MAEARDRRLIVGAVGLVAVIAVVYGGLIYWSKTHPTSQQQVLERTSIAGLTRTSEFLGKSAIATLVGPQMTDDQVIAAATSPGAVFAPDRAGDVGYYGVARAEVTSSKGVPCRIWIQRARTGLDNEMWKLSGEQKAAAERGDLMVVEVSVSCGTG